MHTHADRHRHRWHGTKPPRRGNVLVEFAFIALILYFLLAVTFDFGRAIVAEQVIQQASDFMARELAHTPLPATATLKDILEDNPQNYAAVRDNIFAEDRLAINLADWSSGQTLLDFLDTLNPPLPSVNRLLIPLMIVQDSTQNPSIASGQKWLVYPGALRATSLTQPSGGTGYTGFTVRIPQVTYAADGSEQIAAESQWFRVVEPISATDSFSITSSQRGLVALRINFPFQAAGLSGKAGTGPYIEASGDELTSGQVGGPYSGASGLGQQAAFTKTVRPFRKVLSAQAIYRREIFQ